MPATNEHIILLGRKYVTPYSKATAKHKWHKFKVHLNTKSLSNFPEGMNECANRAFRPLAQQIIDSLLYAKISQHLKS